MKKIQKKILAVILSAIVAFSMPTALAVDAYYNLPLDVGNHHRYSGGSRSRSRSRSNPRSRSRSYSSSGRSSSSSGSSEIDEKNSYNFGNSIFSYIRFSIWSYNLVCKTTR